VTVESLPSRIHAVSHLSGDFALRSGVRPVSTSTSTVFEVDPDLLEEVAARMALLVPPRTEVLAGLELGGIAVVTVR
jgi:orotate phosphoribosyltransferase